MRRAIQHKNTLKTILNPLVCVMCALKHSFLVGWSCYCAGLYLALSWMLMSRFGRGKNTWRMEVLAKKMVLLEQCSPFMCLLGLFWHRGGGGRGMAWVCWHTMRWWSRHHQSWYRETQGFFPRFLSFSCVFLWPHNSVAVSPLCGQCGPECRRVQAQVLDSPYVVRLLGHVQDLVQ